MNKALRLVAHAMIALGTFAALGPAMAQTKGDVRIGYQKSSTLLTIIKSKGTIEAALAPLGLKVRWSEFTSGLPLLEALNVGAKLTYVAQEAPSPSAQAIVVPEQSPITKVADLKGKKAAAGSHYLLLVALERAGLKLKDIEPAYLTPADGRAALTSGSVAAWVTWDPFLAAVQRQSKVRILADGRDLADYQRYYLAATSFAEARPDVVKVIFAELQKTGTWVKQNPAEAATFLAPLWGLDADTVALANTRRSYGVRTVVPSSLGEQQRIADVFLAEGLLPKRITATDASIWKPGS